MVTNLIMILVNPSLREEILELLANSFPKLKIKDGEKCFTVTEDL